MIVGDLVPNQSLTGLGRNHKPVTVPGRCVYIHPKRRYFTLEFNLPGGIVRENYHFKYRRGDSK